MTIDQNPAGMNDSTEDVAAEPAPRCKMGGPDSWDLFLQGNFFCELPRGHAGQHYEKGAPRKWNSYE
ncbi:hypothetical protein [Streptomyces sp. NPDC058579]|uniref:hypothetical protein n=1 Tax=Streptomyces sp. NPDC058579 TaxID=3346548 RepID=UPI00364F8FBA